MTDHAAEDHHPAPGFYIAVALALAAITAVEIVIILPDVKAWYQEHATWFVPLVLPVLFVLSVVKFLAVVGFFMHLAQDRGATRTVFFWPLLLALLMILMLMLLYGNLV